MLEWTSTNGIWFGNGFRIERLSPEGWVLLDNAAVSSDVVADPVLAIMPSLKSAKHLAETRHSAETPGRERRRLMSVALGMGALALLVTENPVAFIATVIVGGAALLELAATYLERFYGRAREVIQ